MSVAVKRMGFAERAEKIRDEINQIFSDAEYWNSHVRRPTEERINPDPRGELRDALKFVNNFLTANFGTRS